MERTIPGTNMAYSDDDAFSAFKSMIEVTGGLSLSQVCTITSLQTSTIQNWVKRGYTPRPINKKYYERHLARILLINCLRDSINIEQIDELMKSINGNVNDESDDIISESKLYDYFSKAVRQLDTTSISDQHIEKIVTQILKDEDTQIFEKLKYSLKFMVYAYITGKCLKKVEENFQILTKL